MSPIAVLLTIACASVAALDIRTELLNKTNIDKRVLKRLSTILESNKTLDNREILILNKTAQSLDLDKALVTKLMDLVKQNNNNNNNSVPVRHGEDFKPDYNAYEDNSPNIESGIGVIEESPDYASSVVLASDLLSLTSAVARVKDKTCQEQGYKFLDGLLLNKRWALKMFDASAKSPQGLLFGSSYHLGNFDECVGIDDAADDGATLEGQYCLATITWRQTEEAKKVRTGRGETLRWAVCVPSACGASAVAGFVTDVLAHTVGNATNTEVKVIDRDCYTRRPITVSKFDVIYLSIILLFVTILALSTMYEAYQIKWGKNKSSVMHELIVSFSAISNVKKIISTKQNTSLGLECITGIKTLSMIIIISGHACLFIGSGPVMDADAWDRLVQDPINALVVNNALLVDTFLMLSAFLFCRLLLIELDKRDGKLNVIPILIFRYLRLTPAYLIVILFYMTWLPKIGEGPLWKDRLLLEQERCRASWWANILYINNYVNTDNLCMFQSWYLSVDTQLFCIAPIFIYSLWRWKKVGPILLASATIISLLVPAAITYCRRLDATILFYAKEFTDIVANYYFKEAYIKTHMKMTSYFMGLLAGYILYRIQTENYQFSRLMKLFGWITSLVLGTVSIFSIALFYQPWYQYSVVEAAAYISLHKLAWGIANAWLLIACATGNGGIFSKLLNWKFLVPLARLTYCAYLVNGVVELYYVGQLRHPLHVNFFTVLATAISHMVLTFVLAMVLCVTFESPIHGIEKILLKMFVPVRPLSEHVRSDQSNEDSRNTSQSKLDT